MRTSVPVWVELTCAFCGDSTQGQHVTGPLNGIKLPMLRGARAEGWVFVEGKAYCSKDHQKQAAARHRRSAVVS